jgi:alanine racemase
MSIVKANAYGHGDIACSKALEAAGSNSLGVAITAEGVRLRESGIKIPIIILGGIYSDDLEQVIELDLTPVIFNIETAIALDKFARSKGIVKSVHIKIDSGMGRLGLLTHQVQSFFKAFKELKNLRVEGLLSHFSESEVRGSEYSTAQLSDFLDVVRTVKEMGYTPDFIHMSNSAAILDSRDSHLDLVRPGLMLYGVYPSESYRELIELRPVLSLKTKILQLKAVSEGFAVSYGRSFVTKRKSIIATIPIGYGDGLPRRLTGSGEVLINGQRAPIIGAICMDLTIVDVTDIKGVDTDDEVVIIGKMDNEEVLVEELAEKTGTISYEILCNISSRVPRVYNG